MEFCRIGPWSSDAMETHASTASRRTESWQKIRNSKKKFRTKKWSKKVRIWNEEKKFRTKNGRKKSEFEMRRKNFGQKKWSKKVRIWNEEKKFRTKKWSKKVRICREEKNWDKNIIKNCTTPSILNCNDSWAILGSYFGQKISQIVGFWLKIHLAQKSSEQCFSRKSPKL
jgi:hypothetical protein